ncbi:MAG: Nudix-related transcriptional regulator NrtR [Thermoleophilia bacterium]|jgi:8-oxo-dGTP diphosphatase|nr:Nudix-related transcriptional regulator NrtR [Thermoleophilia bacterium]
MPARHQPSTPGKPDVIAIERPTVAVDVVLLTAIEGELRVLVARREEVPYLDRWALPGVIVRSREALHEAATRALHDKVGLPATELQQLHAFGFPDRDPRSRVISVGYFALVPAETLLGALRQTSERVLARVVVPWSGVTGGSVEARHPDGESLELAFDHAHIVGKAVQRVRRRLAGTEIGIVPLLGQFPSGELEAIHTAIRGE